MCGIAGYVSLNGIIDKKKFETMVDIVGHRGPDDRGVFYDENVALGHRRLAVLDVSAAGRQPYHYMDRYIIVFNGEVYNYIELKRELTEAGYVFNTKTDTEVIVAAYDCYGKECAHKFNGMWAFAIYDKESHCIFCSRDRFGIKPFYYTISDNTFIFASEIKQILVMTDGFSKINEKILKAYIISGNCEDYRETFFKDIYKLPSGHNLFFQIDTGNNAEIQYYNIEDIKPSNISYNYAVEKFKNLFENSVSIRLRSDVSVGYCLSGGLDSSAIVCTADKIVKQNNNLMEQHTISSCYCDQKYDEQEYIDAVTINTNVTAHKIFPDMTQYLNELDKIIWYRDEPCISGSLFSQWNVFNEAKCQGMTVMLDGQGADEQLAGYTEAYLVLFATLVKKLHFVKCYKEMKDYVKKRAEFKDLKSNIKLFFKVIFNALGLDKLKNYIIVYFPKIYTKFQKIVFGRVVDTKSLFSKKDLNDIQFFLFLKPKNNYEKYQCDDFVYGLTNLLHNEDRNSMAHSIESRVPFLDYRLVELLVSLPLSYKIKNGVTKRIMRDALLDTLPDKILNRTSKLAFAAPEKEWYYANLDVIDKEFIDAAKEISRYIDLNNVLEWYNQYKKFKKINIQLVMRIIYASHWIQIFKLSGTN